MLEENPKLNRGSKVAKKTREIFYLQPQTEEAAESKLGEELQNYDATGHDKRFQCMSA